MQRKQMPPSKILKFYLSILLFFLLPYFCKGKTAQIRLPEEKLFKNKTWIPPASAWKKAKTFRNFTSLANGKQAANQTLVRAFYTKKGLYFYFICRDNDPKQISAYQQVRNESFSSDDYVEVYLDPFRDGQGLYLFMVNPLGTQSASDTRDYYWDRKWYSWGKITRKGWEAVLFIPFKIFRWPLRKKQKWGVQFLRYLKRKNDTTIWHYTGLSSSLNPSFFPDISLHIPKEKSNPYVILRAGSQRTNNGSISGGIGADFRYPITPELLADLTAYPQFAPFQEQTLIFTPVYGNVTFPETRPFFQEGATYFNGWLSGWVNMFNSYDIGNFKYGEKVDGKIGTAGIGILNVSGFGLDDQVVNLSDNLQNGEFSFGSEWEKSTENGESSDTAQDFYIGKQFGKHFVLTGVWGYNQALSPLSETYQISSSYSQGGLGIYAQEIKIGNNFSPPLGFVQFPGIQGTNAGAYYSMQRTKGVIEQLITSVNWNDFHNPETGQENLSSQNGFLDIRFQNQLEISSDYSSTFYNGILDHQDSFSFAYNTIHPDNFNFYDTWGTFEGEPTNTVSASFNLQPFQSFQFFGSYLHSQFLPYTAKINNRIWEADIEYNIGKSRTLSMAWRGDFLGHANLFLVYHQLLGYNRDLYFVLGNPNAVSTTGGMTVDIEYRI